MKNIIYLFGFFFLFSCQSEDNEGYIDVDTNEPMEFLIPSNFPDLAQDISNNMPTTKGFELGRKLFYDGRLSRDGTISCAFCHEQSSAFTHHGHDFSHGVDDLSGTRNAPAVQNMAFQREYFFDGASNAIEMLSINPIHNPVEMDETLGNIVSKLKQDPAYVKLFSQAFEDRQVTSGNVLKALAQFMTMMISSNSRYDKYVRNESGGTLNSQELQGLQVFQNKCASCHATDLFSDNSFRNNGLPPNQNLNDLGREVVTGFENDRYKFKVPSLRNIELTAPYMHDGRFGSLNSVLNFYSSGVQHTPNLDPLLNQNGNLGIDLSAEEKDVIIAFLKTLTDEEYINNPLFYFRT